MEGEQRTTSAWVSVGVLTFGLLAFVTLAMVLVPWNPIPGPALRPVPVDQVFSAAEVVHSQAFANTARWLSLGSLGSSLLVLAVLSLAPATRRLLTRLPGPLWCQVPVAVLAVSLVLLGVRLPFALQLQQLRLEYQLSQQSWTLWVLDIVKSVALDVALASLLIGLLLWLMRRLPRTWPAAASALAALAVIAGSFAYPLLVEPLFNSFSSLPSGPLRSSILAQAERQHVSLDDILVADASRRTTTLNAYVSGFGSSRRVVLYDTLLESEPMAAIQAVVAHELSHARHRDVVSGTLLGASGAVIGVGVLGLLLRRRPGLVLVPVLVALAAWGSVVSSPISSGISRQLETRADVDALRATGDRDGFVALQRQLALRSLSDPEPPGWLSWWFGTHPQVRERIAIADRVLERNR